jgi:triosephosphate isomerase
MGRDAAVSTAGTGEIMARKKLIAANWKMNKTISEARAFVETMIPGLGDLPDCDILIFPPYMAVPRTLGLLDGTNVSVGAQDLYYEDEGAFTGEISGGMIADVGATYVLVGHSERRHVIGESNELISRKLQAALRYNLTPILCVGEKIEHREAGEHEAYVREQLDSALSGLAVEQMTRVVIAYEPVWAIGTGKTATPEDAVTMHTFVREWVREVFRGDVAGRLRIQYGGSVKPENASRLLSEEQIDGALIGGAALDPASFLAIAAAVPRT